MQLININNLDSNRFRTFLREELVRRCKINEAYSLRAFARDLEIDHSVFSKILSGKRSLGQKLMNRLIQKIEVTETQIKNLLIKENNNEINESSEDYEQIAIDSFIIISDWHHYAILELIRVDSFKADLNWVAKSLGIKKIEAKVAIERLVRVGLLKIEADGSYTDLSGGKSTNISNEMSSSAFRKMQKQLLEKSIKCIDQVEYEKRNNTSMTMAIDTEKLPEAVEEIKKFRRRMGKLLSRGDKRDEVYNLSIALCPLSQIKEKK